MGFFDLNIPYLESSPSSTALTAAQKAARIKIVVKAMELGYTGIAYNRTMKGVMSERDRCSIPLLTLSSLLKVAPSLSSSVNFHRDLLGIPRTSPFRQYTRLTVSVDSIPQCQALNSGNPVLKTYDIVAARPLNQIAFDYSCEKAEVDIVSVDFSDKMNFRLKQPMVKAAVQRGVCFEIAYSDLIVDVEARRQMISNAKMLVDWTRGKNLIFSSAAPSVCELRGPNDVANLGFLLGVSNERARAAVSKNCRTLIANALKRKHFFKEAIRIEPILSKHDSGKPLSLDWLKWDPISSGDGDLVLDDASKESETVKAIDFTSAIDNMPSHGFELKNLVSGANSEKFDNETIKSTPEIEEVRKGVSEEEPKNLFVSDVHMEDSEFISLDSDDLPLLENTSDRKLTQDPGDEKAREVIMEEQKAGEPETVSEVDSAIPDKANEGSNLKADGHGAATVSNEVSLNEIIEEEVVTAAAYEADIEPISCIIAKDEPSTAEKKTQEEEAVKTQEPGESESDSKTDHSISAKVTTGKSRGRRRICHPSPFSPLNRILHRATFKRRARKSRQ